MLDKFKYLMYKSNYSPTLNIKKTWSTIYDSDDDDDDLLDDAKDVALIGILRI